MRMGWLCSLLGCCAGRDPENGGKARDRRRYTEEYLQHSYDEVAEEGDDDDDYDDSQEAMFTDLHVYTGRSVLLYFLSYYFAIIMFS